MALRIEQRQLELIMLANDDERLQHMLANLEDLSEDDLHLLLEQSE